MPLRSKQVRTKKVPRQFHRKSRFGCVVCKSRRVKCDEGQPTCGGCAKLRLHCSYSLSHEPQLEATCTTASAVSSPNRASSPVSTGDGSATPSQLESYSYSHFDLFDLSLMHHYATDTFQHLFAGETHSQVWQHHIPALAASHDVLMHGILALTALHRVRACPEQRDSYWARALHHHGAGLRLFRGLLESVTCDNAEVVVACAIALGIWIYASPGATSEYLPLGDILGMFEIVRHGSFVFKLHREAIVGTPTGLFLIPPCGTPLEGDEVSSTRKALQSLREQVRHPSDERAVYRLQIFMDQYLVGTGHARSAVSWMASVDQDYWVRLNSHHPQALLIFAYSSLLTSVVEHDCWWLAGWCERILLACSEALTPADKEAINWCFHERLIRSCGVGLANVARERKQKLQQD